jgi:hypothetical protein
MHKTELDPAGLRVLQSGLRLPLADLRNMWDYVYYGHYFDQGALKVHNPTHAGLIVITEMQSDGRRYVRDGLHRVCMLCASRRAIAPMEYVMETGLDYDDFNAINVAHNWVTPFDPKTEVRLPDFRAFKQEVLAQPTGQVAAFISGNRHRYCTRRTSAHNVHAITQKMLHMLIHGEQNVS